MKVNKRTGLLESDLVMYLASPNFNERPGDTEIDLLVIHNISLPPRLFGGNAIDDFFCNQLDFEAHPYFAEINSLRVSAHLLIRRDGRMTQYVSFKHSAWHAGVSSFKGRDKCNDFSIGIELEGADDIPYTDLQYQYLTKITRVLMETYPGITMDAIVGHADIAPGRKTDPGSAFDWVYYHKLLE